MGSIILGVILIIVSLFGITFWWWDIIVFLRGFLPVFLLILGIVAIAGGLEFLREPPQGKEKQADNIDEEIE